MDVRAVFPMVASRDLPRSRDFYVSLGFICAYEDTWYIHLVWPGDPTQQFGVMTPDHDSQPPIYRTDRTGGVFLGIQVEDVDAVHDRLVALGHEIVVPLTTEPWGQRHFGIQDPCGLPIDIAMPTPPTPHYAAKFKPVPQTRSVP